MKYTLETGKGPRQQRSLREYGSKFLPLFATEKAPFAAAVAAILISSGATLVAPVIIVRTIDTDIRLKNMQGLLISALFVFLIYAAGAVASYVHGAVAPGLGKIGVIVALESSGDGEKLNQLGVEVIFKTIVGDSREHLTGAAALALSRAAIVIFRRKRSFCASGSG